jgi:stearoyl-CoA desaturase (delta-9 desaturase)
MRAWLWLTTGMITRQWVAIHRKHHRFSDQPGDPHSPHVFGIKNILLKGVTYYMQEGRNAHTILSYGRGTPNDWIERRLYTPHNFVGVFILLAVNALLFGWWAPLIWLAQILWIPFWAAGVVNGIGHWWGYRNGETREHSRNFLPIGIWIGGEELHNNHHLAPASPKLSRRWWEFDIGWFWICILRFFKLAELQVK